MALAPQSTSTSGKRSLSLTPSSPSSSTIDIKRARTDAGTNAATPTATTTMSLSSTPSSSSSPPSSSPAPPSSVPSLERTPSTGSAAAGGKKKLIIKSFKVPPKPPPSFEETTFAKLTNAVQAVYSRSAVDISHEDLYRSVESLCLHKKAAELYEKLYGMANDHIGKTLNALNAIMGDAQTYLTHVESDWKDHCDQMLIIRGIFLYLDRTYVITNAKVRSLWDMGLQLFATHFRGTDVERRTVSSMLTLIERERLGDSINKSLVANVRSMFSALQLYKKSFEKAFLDATDSFYESEGNRLQTEMSVPEYLNHIHKRLQQEMTRVVDYLDEPTRRALIAIVEIRLIKQHVEALITKGFDALLADSRCESLSLMYILFDRVGALPRLKEALVSYIKRTGSSIVMPEEKDADMVTNLLAFKATLDEVMKRSFNSNEEFTYALKSSFESFINERENRPAELIAKFIDGKLKASKGSSEEELDQILNRVMVLFRYIHGKDVFQAFYKKDLSRRLLLGTSASVDMEKTMIAKIKAECGASFTAKLEGMFKDMEASKDVQRDFDMYLKQSPTPPAIEFGIQVLTTSNWPPTVPQPIVLPAVVATLCDQFRTEYLGKHTGRKLIWDNTKSTCILRAVYPKGNKHEFSVSANQAVALLLFNSVRTLSFDDIKTGTGLDERECIRTLTSLACGKIRILNKRPTGATVGVTDQFQVNLQFHSPQVRIKINSIQTTETKEENKATSAKIFVDRQFALDALIVRIMKSRKALAHSQLVAEILQQCKFPAPVPEIKKRIASLIERDYMERDPDNANMYRYMA